MELSHDCYVFVIVFRSKVCHNSGVIGNGPTQRKGQDMTRKDYELMAGAILDARAVIESRELDGAKLDEQWKATATVARHLAAVLEAQNPRFNRGRFLAACGLDPVNWLR